MTQKQITVLGGSGFVGSHLIARFAKAGHYVRVLTRHRERQRHLLVLPTVEVIQADIHHLPVLEYYFSGQDAIVNLVGILNEPRDNGLGFRHAHVDLAEKVVHACLKLGIKRLLHMSALHANAEQGPSYYLRSKGEAQKLVHAAHDLDVTSFCPSVIFGPGDSFFNNFASLIRFSPGIVPLACPSARFAPVYVGDVVEAMLHSLHDAQTIGQSYNLCGPKIYTLKQLLQYTAQQIHARRLIVGLGQTPSRLMANFFQYMPFFRPITRDNYRSLQIDSICTDAFPAIFGIVPRSIEEIVPTYLGDRAHAQRYPLGT